VNAEPAPLEARRARARRGDGDKLRLEILAAAERLLALTADESAVSIRAVADAVGVTPPSIYLHFADKEELLIEVCETNFDDVSRAVEEAAAGASDPLEAIKLACLAYARFWIEHPEEYRILFMRKAPTPEREQIEMSRLLNSSGYDWLLGAVQECMDAGLMRRTDPLLAVVGVWSMVHGITSLLISKPGFSWPALEDLIAYNIDAHLNGLKP
jgi:AcrR family transcriptional regulator